VRRRVEIKRHRLKKRTVEDSRFNEGGDEDRKLMKIIKNQCRGTFFFAFILMLYKNYGVGL